MKPFQIIFMLMTLLSWRSYGDELKDLQALNELDQGLLSFDFEKENQEDWQLRIEEELASIDDTGQSEDKPLEETLDELEDNFEQELDEIDEEREEELEDIYEELDELGELDDLKEELEDELEEELEDEIGEGDEFNPEDLEELIEELPVEDEPKGGV